MGHRARVKRAGRSQRCGTNGKDDDLHAYVSTETTDGLVKMITPFFD